MFHLISKSSPREIVDVYHVNPPMVSVLYTFELRGLTARAIEEAERASFYGIHAGTQRAGVARRAISDVIGPILPQLEPGWCSWSIRSAKSTRQEGDKAPYRAEVVIEVEVLV